MAARSAHLPRTLSHLRSSTSSLAPRFLSANNHFLQPASATTRRHASSNFESMPSPFRLPPDQQAEFERLQRTANTQEGFNPTSTPDFSSPTTETTNAANSNSQDSLSTPVLSSETPDPDAPSNTRLRKGAPPEFEGEVNPRTGEVGGPKNEPLRWGAGGDYSYNGRVTDF